MECVGHGEGVVIDDDFAGGGAGLKDEVIFGVAPTRAGSLMR